MAQQKLSEHASLGDVSNPFTWQMLQLFGAFPAVLDRHITEFFPRLFGKPNSYYGKTLGTSSDTFSFERTIEDGDRIFSEMSEQALSPGPLSADYFTRIGGEHEQVLDIVSSIRRDTGDIYSANLPNQGQVPNLPLGAVIEGPAVATTSGVRAIAQAPLPPGLAGTLATRFQWVETVVEAALSGERKLVVQALLIDGAVDSVEMAYKLADDLLSAQAAYLPQFK
jgi:alpha-galactosidase